MEEPIVPHPEAERLRRRFALAQAHFDGRRWNDAARRDEYYQLVHLSWLWMRDNGLIVRAPVDNYVISAFAGGPGPLQEQFNREQDHRHDLSVIDDGNRCNCKSPVLKDSYGDDTETVCWLRVGHEGDHVGTDGANGWLHWRST